MEHPQDQTRGEPLFLINYINIFNSRGQFHSYLINKTEVLCHHLFLIINNPIIHALLFVRCDGVEDDEEEKPFCFYNI